MLFIDEHLINLEIWKRLFEEIGLNGDSSVIDLCPGDDPKIEDALSLYGFQGNVVAVDASKIALDSLLKKASGQFNLVAAVRKIQEVTIKDSTIIAANHIIDDLISFEYCIRSGKEYAHMREDVAYSRMIWDSIISDSAELQEFAIATIAKVALQLPVGGYLIISQYPSKFERMHGFNSETQVCLNTLECLSKRIKPDFSELSYLVNKAFESCNSDVYRQAHWKVFMRA